LKTLSDWNGEFNFLVFLNVCKRCLMQASLCFKMEKFLNKKRKQKSASCTKKQLFWLSEITLKSLMCFSLNEIEVQTNWCIQCSHWVFTVYNISIFIWVGFLLKIMLDKRERHKPIYQAHSLSVKASRWNNILSIVW
jgi:hypothetical protein